MKKIDHGLHLAISPALCLTLGISLASSSKVFAEDLESLFKDEPAKAEPKNKDSAKSKKGVNSSNSLDEKIATKVMTPLTLAVYELLGKRTSEQNIFIRYLESEDWQRSLLQFSPAFEGTAFQRSNDGRALLGLLQFKTGLKISGVETLFLASNPKEIHAEIVKEWKKVLSPDSHLWQVVQVSWQDSWAGIFGENPKVTLALREARETQDIATLLKLSSKLSENSSAQNQVNWQLVLAYSMNDEADKAGKILAKMMKSESTPISKDLMNITAARMLYQNGYFDSAIKLYEKVDKASDYWPEAQEEIAWSYIRKGEPQNAMAVTNGLVKPAVASIVGPETYFIHSLSQMKVCNYTGVAESLDQFSKVFKKRTLELNQLASASNTAPIEKVIDLMKTKEISYKDIGAQGVKFPTLISRDTVISDLAKSQKILEDESVAADKVYAQSLEQTGLQGRFEKLKNDVNQRAFRAKTASIQRVRDLAKNEVEETRSVLKKMHIIEAEILQQTMIADKIAKNAGTAAEKNGTTGAKGDEVVKFPNETEFWFDEISNYKIDVKKPCVSKR